MPQLTKNNLLLSSTGTLTNGLFRVCDSMVTPEDDPKSDSDKEKEEQDMTQDKTHALTLAAALEAKSTHPLATAILEEFSGGCIAEMDIDSLLNARNIKVLEGVGIEGWVEDEDWKYVIVGNERILSTNGGSTELTDRQERDYEAFMKV